MKSKKILIESTMIDNRQKLKLSSLFSIFQDFATSDAEDLKMGHAFTTDVGKLWVFTRVFAVIPSYADYLTTSEATTYCGKTRAFLFPRQMVLRDSKRNIQAQISSLWALIDKNTRKLIIKPGLKEPKGYEFDYDIPYPEKIIGEPCSLNYSRKIRHNDIDLNGHFNNVRYVEVIVDVNDSEFYANYEISSLLINFEKEIHEGETIDIYTNSDNTYIKGVVNELTCFEAKLTYRKIQK